MTSGIARHSKVGEERKGVGGGGTAKMRAIFMGVQNVVNYTKLLAVWVHGLSLGPW